MNFDQLMQRDQRRRQRRQQRSISFQDFWGKGYELPDIRGDSIATSATLVPLFAATRLIAESIASLPLHTYRDVNGRGQPAPAAPLLREPTLYGSLFDWLHRAATSLLFRGNAYGYITSWTEDAYPRMIEWLHPDEITLTDNRYGITPRPQWFWMGQPIDPGRLLHIAGYTLPGQILGLSPIKKFQIDIETGLLTRRFGHEWFKNGSIPSAVLESEHAVTEDQAKEIKRRFKAAAAGREPVVLGAGAAYKPITVNPDESQFLETIRANANDVAAIYGVPPEMIGGEPAHSNTYQNVEQRSLNFHVFALRPWLIRLEYALTQLLPEPLYVKFNVDAIVRADLKTRYEAHSLALRDGWKSKDEIRQLEELPPLPDGQGSGYQPVRAPEPAAQRDLEDGRPRSLRAVGDR